jgi:hypothetical protein
MKNLIKIVLLPILIFTSAISCKKKEEIIITRWPEGQKQVTYKIFAGDTANLLDAYYCAYYPNGQVWKRGYFKNRLETGEWFHYYQSGKLKGKGSMKNGVKDGEFEVYYESGETEQFGSYKNGLPTYIIFRDRAGFNKPKREDLTKYIIDHPVKWTDAQKKEIWIDFYVAAVVGYKHAEAFSDCVLNLLQQHCNFSDVQAMTDKQRGDLLKGFKEDCSLLLESKIGQ